MLINLNYSKRDPKFILLGKIFKIINSKITHDIFSQNQIYNHEIMVNSIKIIFTSMFFSYDVSNVINELNRTNKLRKFMGLKGEVPTAESIYEYVSRFNPEQYSKNRA